MDLWKLLVFGVLPLACLVWAIRLWRRSRSVQDPNVPFCRKCGYNLSGLTTHRCPECGADLSSGGIDFGRRAGSLRPLLLATTLAIAAIALLASSQAPAIQNLALYDLYPTSWLIDRIAHTDPAVGTDYMIESMNATWELADRARTNELTDEQHRRICRLLAERVVLSSPKNLPFYSNYLEGFALRGRGFDEGVRSEFILRGVQFEFRMREAVPQGREIGFELRIRESHQPLPGFDLSSKDWVIEWAELSSGPAALFRGDVLRIEADGAKGFLYRGYVTSFAAIGRETLTLRLKYSRRPFASGLQPFRHEVSAHVEIVPETGKFIRRCGDPALNQQVALALRNGLRVRSDFHADVGESWLVADFAISTLPVPAAIDVRLRGAHGTYKYGTVLISRTGRAEWLERMPIAIPAGRSTIGVQLFTNAEVADRTLDISEVADVTLDLGEVAIQKAE